MLISVTDLIQVYYWIKSNTTDLRLQHFLEPSLQFIHY